jgi:predicted GNAT family acetyltransferase
MIASLIQNNIQQLFLSIAPKAGFEINNFGNITSVYSDTPGPDYNLMFDYQPSKTLTANLHQALSYSQHKRYPFIIIREQHKTSEEVEALFTQFKYQKAGIATKMAIFHDELNFDNVDRSSIKQVQDQTMLEDFCNIIDEAFNREPGSSKLFFDPIHDVLGDRGELKLYLAFSEIDGKLSPVASTMLFAPNDKELLAGHYGWAVKEQHRKQGIMSNLVKNMILVAKELGYFASIAQCYDASVSLATNLGFKEYGVLDIYTNAGQVAVHEAT